jgi:hypothetical protein
MSISAFLGYLEHWCFGRAGFWCCVREGGDTTILVQGLTWADTVDLTISTERESLHGIPTKYVDQFSGGVQPPTQQPVTVASQLAGSQSWRIAPKSSCSDVRGWGSVDSSYARSTPQAISRPNA